MPDLSTIANDLAIRDLAARYIDAVNRMDGKAWQSTWSESGSWSLMGTEISGRDQLLPFWEAAMSGFTFAIMVLNSGTVELDGDSATGRWYVTEHLLGADGNGAMVLGVYDDHYVRENGQWLFGRRVYNVLYQGPADLGGNYTPYQA